MDLDTNVKKFRYSFACKALCIIISAVTFFVAAASAFLCFASYDYCQSGVPESFTQSSYFERITGDAISCAVTQICNGNDDEYGYEWYSLNGSMEAFAVSKNGDIAGYPYGTENFDLDSFYNHNMYFVWKDGKITAKGIDEKTVAEIVNNLSEFYDEFPDIYVYYNISAEKTNIVDSIINYDSLAAVSDFHDTAVRCYSNLDKYIALAAIMLILSFISGFGYLTVAGRKSNAEPAKAVFIDYVPLEIHLGISVLLGVGVVGLLATVSDELILSKIFVSLFSAGALAIWLLLFEFCASVARLIKSERKFYKNFLVYDIAYLLVIIGKKSLKLDKRIIKAVGKSAERSNKSFKNIFSRLRYKPTKFKKNAIIIAIIYALCNMAALLVLVWVWSFVIYEMFYGYNEFFVIILAILLTAADLGANIFFLSKVLNYIQQLDMIIDSASRHEDVPFDIEALPESLRCLAESMKYTNTELHNAVAKAVRDERLKTELITNVSHDLKTPLTSIINYVDLLSKCSINDEKAKDYIRVLDEKGAKLKRLIDDLIEASKVTSGNVSVNLAPINLSELCLQATVDAQESFDKAGLSLIVKAGEKPYTVVADGSKAYRVIENLLSNALKYSAKGSRVYVSIYEEQGFGIFEIKNVSAQPLDISADELTERFVRGDKSRNMEGNGLGLSIAKELSRLQNGNLEITIDGDLFKARVKLPVR